MELKDMAISDTSGMQAVTAMRISVKVIARENILSLNDSFTIITRVLLLLNICSKAC